MPSFAAPSYAPPSSRTKSPAIYWMSPASSYPHSFLKNALSYLSHYSSSILIWGITTSRSPTLILLPRNSKVFKNMVHKFKPLALWPLSNNLTCLCLGFLVCKSGIIYHKIIEKIEKDAIYKNGLNWSWSTQYRWAIFLSKMKLNSLVLWSQPSMKLGNM